MAEIKKNITVGIDFGTTNSLIAFVNEDSKVIVVPVNEDLSRSTLLPSVVRHDSLGKSTEIISVKRLIGDNPTRKKYINYFGGEEFDFGKNIISMAMGIFKNLRSKAEEYTESTITDAVITVPAHFNDSARISIKTAAELAGFNVIRMINEPTAAAIAHCMLDNLNDRSIMVYDLGGGTFDISILQVRNRIFRVISTSGDSTLGGDDFDIALANLLNAKCGFEEKVITNDMVLQARKIKEILSLYDNYTGSWRDHEVCCTRCEFEEATQTLVDRTFDVMHIALKDAQLSLNDIREVIFVGGATRMPMIKEKAKRYMNGLQVDFLADSIILPEEAVVIGAAMHAKSLSSQNGTHLLLDVIPLSIGIEVLGGAVECIIPRNTPIPIMMKSVFTNSHEEQNSFDIHITQGEGEHVMQCKTLAKFKVPIIHKVKKQEAKLELLFCIDVNGILSVTAVERVGGTVRDVIIKPQYNLSEEEINALFIKENET
ncbi:Hsp70 family protein [Candidatus Fokinia crypta]|uniref:Chaperone protein HscA n=1 Tax=Candidatus Fokinia crypta TaxID=1920990 RepID=A0ABZ0UPB6_9RICK|nr:Hsp70 family protein [Candidatus Fokinia cryptica]WPX97737.1 Chaperone protein HscA [Candidatus Fokinia cryptica]